MPPEPTTTADPKAGSQLTPAMVSTNVAGHHALDEHPFPAGIGVVEVHGSLKFVPCLPQGPRVSYIELDEPGFRLVRDVRRDALERHGIADGFGGGLCFFGRLGQAFAQGRDAEVGENPRRQRVGDDAAAGVQLGKEIGGKGKGGFRFFRKGPVPVQPCRDGPDAFGAALQGGDAAVIKDFTDGWFYPAGNVGYDDHRLARVRPVPALLLRPRRRTGRSVRPPYWRACPARR